MSFKEQRCLTTIITDIKMLSKFCSCTVNHKIPCISQNNRWHLGRRKKRAELGLSCGKSCYWPEITALSWENPRLSRQVGAWPRSGKRTRWKSGRMGRGRRDRAPRGANAPIPGHSWSPPWLTGCCTGLHTTQLMERQTRHSMAPPGTILPRLLWAFTSMCSTTAKAHACNQSQTCSYTNYWYITHNYLVM